MYSTMHSTGRGNCCVDGHMYENFKKRMLHLEWWYHMEQRLRNVDLKMNRWVMWIWRKIK